jgi:hypothetical protein
MLFNGMSARFRDDNLLNLLNRWRPAALARPDAARGALN